MAERAANNGGTATDNSTASGAQAVANNGRTATDARDMSDSSTDNSGNDNSVTATNNGTGAVASGSGDAVQTNSSVTETATATADTGAASITNQFGANALVAASNLSSYVTGVTVTYSTPTGSTTSGTPDNSLSADGAFSSLAGANSINLNTGVAASQNASVSIAASVGRVEPLGEPSISLGMAASLNTRTSFSAGYAHTWSMGTRTRLRTRDVATNIFGDPTTTTTRDLQLGRFLFGISCRVDRRTVINWDIEAGVTDDANDLRTTLRIPFTLSLF